MKFIKNNLIASAIIVLSFLIIIYFSSIFFTKHLFFYTTWGKIDVTSKDNTTGNFITFIGIITTSIFSIILAVISIKTQENNDNLLKIEKYRIKIDMLPYAKGLDSFYQNIQNPRIKLTNIRSTLLTFRDQINGIEIRVDKGWPDFEAYSELLNSIEKDSSLDRGEKLSRYAEALGKNPARRERLDYKEMLFPTVKEENILEILESLKSLRKDYHSFEIEYLFEISNHYLEDCINTLSFLYSNPRGVNNIPFRTSLRYIHDYYNGNDTIDKNDLEIIEEICSEINSVIIGLKNYEKHIKERFNKIYKEMDVKNGSL